MHLARVARVQHGDGVDAEQRDVETRAGAIHRERGGLRAVRSAIVEAQLRSADDARHRRQGDRSDPVDVAHRDERVSAVRTRDDRRRMRAADRPDAVGLGVHLQRGRRREAAVGAE